MREDYGSLSLVTHDQGFGDMSFDAEPPELMRHATAMEPSLDQVNLETEIRKLFSTRESRKPDKLA